MKAKPMQTDGPAWLFHSRGRFALRITLRLQGQADVYLHTTLFHPLLRFPNLLRWRIEERKERMLRTLKQMAD